jgi:hypothetical protein
MVCYFCALEVCVRLTVAVTLDNERSVSATDSRSWDSTPTNAEIIESGERLALTALGRLVALKVCREQEAAAHALAERLKSSADFGRRTAIERGASPLRASTLATQYAFEWLAADGWYVIDALGSTVVCDAVGAMAREVEEKA